MKKPKPHAKENILSEQEIKRLIAACNTKEELLLIKGLLYTGMRISEFLHFRKNWIDWQKGLIHIPYSDECKCYECKGEWTAKTKDAERPIPIVPEVKEVFHDYFATNNRVMDTIRNRIMAWAMVKAIGQRAKIRHKLFPHAIRATFATILAGKGFDVFQLQRALGWKNLSVAAEYVKLSGEQLKKEFAEKW